MSVVTDPGRKRPLRSPAIMRHIGMQRLVSQGTGILPPGLSLGSLHQIPSNSIAVQFELLNMSTSEVACYNAAFALSAGINDFVLPLGPDGMVDSTLWVPITSKGSTDIIVPAATSPQHSGRILTDSIPFTARPPARIDGGGGICLFYRQFCHYGTHTVGTFDGTVGLWRGNKNGRHPGQFSQTFGGSWLHHGNICIEGTLEHHSPPSPTDVYAPSGIIPTTTSPMLTIMSVGDSILSGVSSRGETDRGINGVGLQMTKLLSRFSRPVLHRNGAVSGMSNLDYVMDAANAVTTFIPDIILLEPYSANDIDTTTYASVWTQFQRSMSFAAHAAGLGAAVIVVTNVPYAGIGSPRSPEIWEASRVAANSLVKNSGLPVIDADSIIGMGSDPISYRPGLSNDLVHPNDLAARALAVEGVRVLENAYGMA